MENTTTFSSYQNIIWFSVLEKISRKWEILVLFFMKINGQFQSSTCITLNYKIEWNSILSHLALRVMWVWSHPCLKLSSVIALPLSITFSHFNLLFWNHHSVKIRTKFSRYVDRLMNLYLLCKLFADFKPGCHSQLCFTVT